MRAVDPRLLRHARAARTYLVVTVLLGLVVPGLIVGAFADLFGLAPLPRNNELRFRVWPETAVSLLLAGKKPGAGWEPESQDLTFAQHPGSDQRPYDRLIGDALEGNRYLFARQDTVEAAWKIVDPVLGDVTPVHPYDRGTWGPKEADRLLPERDTWHDPAD